MNVVIISRWRSLGRIWNRDSDSFVSLSRGARARVNPDFVGWAKARLRAVPTDAWWARFALPTLRLSLLSLRGCDADIGFGALRALAAQPVLQAVEIEVHHRRGVKCEQLAERKPAHHGVAKRLAQFRAGAVTERERRAGEQRRSGRHHDGAEAQQARLTDCCDRRHVSLMLGRDGEVDQHD